MPEAAEDSKNLEDCYVEEEERVLDPSLISTTLIDRLPQPTGWRILILPYRPPPVTKAGIFIPDKSIDDTQIQTVVGYVLKVGPQAYKDPTRFPEGPWCKEKQWVVFARYSGSRLKLNEEDNAAFGSEVRILNDDEILGTILDPNDIIHI
jgi:co-chaperonin GroES (HSP10)|tara:strand:+ start:138 stop:587 length:450 start_codon:yes stop_codon:yes gene_type:complete